MDPRIVAAVQEILIGCIQIVILVGATYVAKWVKAHVSKKQMDLAVDIARVAVAAVEQLAASRQIDIRKKFDEALKMARDQAAKYGLAFTDEQWRAIIEAAVKAMKDAGEEIKAAPAA
ncbi:MAG: hypothetical protein HPY58_12765 [Firmicutes bacterium]|nr:hypothetical protein [Bacillota bacterium]